MNISSILNEFNQNNSLNYKRSVCKKYKDNLLFIETFVKTYDRVKWTWGISLKRIGEFVTTGTHSFEWGLKELERLNSREFTGNAAVEHVNKILSSLSEDDANVLLKVINRDLS